MTQHVRDQNWTAIGIDFVIVVVGVFIGIQVSNWNEQRSFRERELRLLRELRAELVRNAEYSRALGAGLLVGAESARRILESASNASEPCDADCWPLVVDFMHASQWQRPLAKWTTYDELRRAGLPTERRVIKAVERYRSMIDRATTGLDSPPVYRSMVRRLIPIELQDSYWESCFIEEAISEIYKYPCDRPVEIAPVDPNVVVQVLRDPDLMMTLREWTSIARMSGDALVTDHQSAARDAILSIDQIIGTDE